MELTAVVLYNEELAYYTVADRGAEGYVAHLLMFGGATGELPPSIVTFCKEGEHCKGSTDNQELMDSIYAAVKDKIIWIELQAQSKPTGEQKPELFSLPNAK